MGWGGDQAGPIDRTIERRAIVVSGAVQGVGFRPFVHGLARRLGLTGFVQNRTGEVLIEAEGPRPALDDFVTELARHPPPLARVDALTSEPRATEGDRAFRIEPSRAGAAGEVVLPADVATCDDCLRELFDPADRRYRYPFLNCTQCGPRLTIVRGVPYDRALTSMQAFGMCEACRAEYENPADRRFHAQPIACAACGPRLAFRDAFGAVDADAGALSSVASALLGGAIVAVKGLGGYHLACDATNERAVAALRARKHREAKPFALMAATVADVERWCHVSSEERAALESPARPIVLLETRAGGGMAPADDASIASTLAASVAPNPGTLGFLLPYTPVHHLLLRDLRDAQGGRPAVLVMTSGNRADEPIAFEDADAIERLRGTADAMLSHDRTIETRCDDSVERFTRGPSPARVLLRRSRGYAPMPVRLPIPVPVPTLALGGDLKAAFALASASRAVVSHHLGNLAHPAAAEAFERALAQYERVYRIAPACIVHDLHPDYASTRYALARAREGGAALLPVQHHHAHMASCMAEHALEGPAIGVCFDGTGLGADGTLWGGEFLVGGYASFTRAAHLAAVPMPGGDAAAREPWRMAVAHRILAGLDPMASPVAARIGAPTVATVAAMVERRIHAPLTSSVGRLFDAVASLAGVCDRTSFEGQAAMRLESLAARAAGSAGAYAFARRAETGSIDAAPVVRAVADDAARGTDVATIARRFHSAVVAMVADTCEALRAETGVRAVVLSGGVFCNAILAGEVSAELTARGLHAYRHAALPPNDGGLALGQLAIAAATPYERRSSRCA